MDYAIAASSVASSALLIMRLPFTVFSPLISRRLLKLAGRIKEQGIEIKKKEWFFNEV